MQCGGRWGNQIDGFGDGFEHESVILKTKSETKHAWAPGAPQWVKTRMPICATHVRFPRVHTWSQERSVGQAVPFCLTGLVHQIDERIGQGRRRTRVCPSDGRRVC